MSDERWYDRGGLIPKNLTRSVRLHPDECVLTGHPMRCVRRDHPTAASDCGKEDQ